MAKTSMNLEENVAGLLCYLIVWVTGIIFYFVEKENKFVRFHAMQSILTFIPLSILAWIVGWIGAPKLTYGYYGWDPGIPALIWLSWLIWVITVILWLILMFKAYNGEKFKLPIVGDIAEKHI
ncbi:MAG: DUF4870 domain-containing protein [Thermoplasmatales archaeon]|nr:DUF4870 domain-containing protein [Thermoplasmatales archaeon]